MKKMSLPIILAVAAITATSYNCSDSKTDNPGWLWEISGNGLAQKSYLFGTCHGGGHSFTHEEIFGFEGVDEALSNVKTVYFETDLTDQIRLAAKEMSIAEYLGCDKDMEKEDLNRLAAKEMSIAEIPGWDKDTEKEDLMPEGVTYESLFDSVALCFGTVFYCCRQVGSFFGFFPFLFVSGYYIYHLSSSRTINSSSVKRNITSLISTISTLFISPKPPIYAFTTCPTWKPRRRARQRAWSASAVR